MPFKFVPPSAEELAARGVEVEKTDEVTETPAQEAETLAKALTEKIAKVTRKKASPAK